MTTNETGRAGEHRATQNDHTRSLPDSAADRNAAADRFIEGPATGNSKKARARQIALLARVLVWCDIAIGEAAEARIHAFGILEIREWCAWALTEWACTAERQK